MLQRKQTLWLLLSLFCAILSYRFPFVTGKDYVKENTLSDIKLTAGNNFLILIVTGIIIIVAAITLFLYKDRKLQMKLCLTGLAISVINLLLYAMKMKKLENATLSLSSILAVAIIAGFFMAFRGIRHDEKLIKSLDKLR